MWLAGGSDWLEVGATPADVRGAFAYAKGKFAVSSPLSLTKTIQAYKAGTLPVEKSAQDKITTPKVRYD